MALKGLAGAVCSHSITSGDRPLAYFPIKLQRVPALGRKMKTQQAADFCATAGHFGLPQWAGGGAGPGPGRRWDRR